MRIIEPHQLARRSIKKKKKIRRPLAVILVILAVGGYLLWRTAIPRQIQNSEATTPHSNVSQNINNTQKKKLKQFTNAEFVALYNTFAYPNTSEITISPKITGNDIADKHIQTIAESRGYKLRTAPVAEPLLVKDGYFLQQKAVQPFLDLTNAAKKDGLTLTLTAAFRSINDQRELFLSRLKATADVIAAGKADDVVNEALNSVAPPGYSRHHNGFTVDIACGTVGGLAFLNTPCYEWLSKDNFKQAKTYGWIPSYPQGTTSVGPEPEPWEYVWVGYDSLLE